MASQGKSQRGFAAMDQEKQREIASKGGRAAHEKGTAHEFTSEEAREAGRKGGQASHGGGRKRSINSQNDDSLSGRGVTTDKRQEIAGKGNRSGK